ncbi:MAG: protein kinase [Terriglobia bacterium]
MATMTLLPGTKLGPYEIESRIGAGGMGEVYRARDTRLGRIVAIKALPHRLSSDPVLKERFAREAKVISNVSHPHICALYDIGHADGTDFLVMEYLEGETLESRLRRGPLPIMEVLNVGIEIADALDRAHRGGIIHRDLKPANVMLTESGSKLLDFGIAKMFDQKDQDVAAETLPTGALVLLTSPGQMTGTVSYMSPEQVRGQQLDASTDLWSLGVVLYQMICSRLPFEGQTSTDVISLILLKDPNPLPLSSHEVPAGLTQVLRRALEKDRGHRYKAAREMLNDLKRCRQKMEIEAEMDRLHHLQPAPESDHEGAGGAGAEQLPPLAEKRPAPSAGVSRAFAPWILDKIKFYKLPLMIGLSVIAAAAAGLHSWLYSAAILVAAALVIAAYHFRPGVESLAVMPFEWVGSDPGFQADPEIDYLSDGITESIINQVSQLPNLKVISRTSVFRFKGKAINPRQIARELDVRKVLTGRILRRGSAFVISVELVDAIGDGHIWGVQYERGPSAFASLPAEIATQVSRNLRARWAGKPAIPPAYSPGPESYQAYLRGRFHWNRRTGEDIEKAIKCFREAVAMDPRNALAYVGLAECYLVVGVYSTMPLREAYSQAKVCALKALEIDDSLAEAHAALASTKPAEEWDLPGALREFARAIEINPNYATAHQWYAEFLVCAGRKAAAITEIKIARELDPLSLVISASVGLVLHLAREYDQAVNQLRTTVEMDRHFYIAHRFLRDVFVEKGLWEEAIAEHQLALNLAGEDAEKAEALGDALRQAYSHGGARAYWQKRLELATQDMESTQRLPYDVTDVSPYHVANIYARVGHQDLAVKWLEKAVEEQDYGIYYLRTNPAFDDLQTRPRVVAVMRRIGLLA